MEHLSDEWIEAFDRIVAGHDGLAGATAEADVTIAYVVTAAPPSVADPDARDASERAYTLRLDHGTNRVLAGRQPAPDVTITTDPTTAAAIAAHAESAQSAFMAGRLRLGGDVRVLMANQSVLAAVDDATRALRDETSFSAATEGGADA